MSLHLPFRYDRRSPGSWPCLASRAIALSAHIERSKEATISNTALSIDSDVNFCLEKDVASLETSVAPEKSSSSKPIIHTCQMSQE